MPYAFRVALHLGRELSLGPLTFPLAVPYCYASWFLQVACGEIVRLPNGLHFLSPNTVFYCSKILLFQERFIELKSKARSGTLTPLIPLAVPSLIRRRVWHMTSVSRHRFYPPAVLYVPRCFLTCLHSDTCVHVITVHGFYTCMLDFHST